MQPEPSNTLRLIEQHLRWYPLMELRDIYKLLYQGVMGAEHLMPSPQVYIQYLTEEFEPLQPDPTERLLEPLRADGALYRLNLRPYKARQQGLEQLTSCLLETAHVITGSIDDLLTAWTGFTQLCLRGQIHKYDVVALQEFSTWLEQLEYPAIHHSDTYNRKYHPAYRLIAAQFIRQLGVDN